MLTFPWGSTAHEKQREGDLRGFGEDVQDHQNHVSKVRYPYAMADDFFTKQLPNNVTWLLTLMYSLSQTGKIPHIPLSADARKGISLDCGAFNASSQRCSDTACLSAVSFHSAGILTALVFKRI